jgi:hypothetical protein
LTDYPDAVQSTHEFDVYVQECEPTLTWDYSVEPNWKAKQTFTIGLIDEIILGVPEYTQSPSCETPIFFEVVFEKSPNTWTLDTDGGALAQKFLTITSTYPSELSIKTGDNTLIGDYQITSFNAYENHYSQQWDLLGGSAWDITIATLCMTNNFEDPNYVDILVGQRNSKDFDLVIMDRVSLDYGNMDGLTVCGSRTYTYAFRDSSGNLISQPSFFTTSASVLTFAPTVADAQDTYTIEVSACLDDLAGFCSDTYSFLATVGPCEVVNHQWSGAIADITNHIAFETGDETFSLITYIQDPLCGYTPQL